MVRAALAGGAVLLAAWLGAVTLGAFGGFDSLPDLKLGGGSEKQASEPAPAAQGEVAGAVAAGRSAGGPAPVAAEVPTTGAPGSPGTVTRPPARQPAKTPAPTQTTIGTTTPGNANGQSDTKVTGKPEGTPGNGNAGSNAGGNGNGNANGKTE